MIIAAGTNRLSVLLTIFVIVVGSICISCSSKVKSFRIDTNNILYLTYPTISEVLFSEYLEKRESCGYLFIFTDAECSSCLFEVGWWNTFVGKYPKLEPVFIAKARYINNFLDHLNFNKYEFAVYHDDDFSVFADNHLADKTEVVMTDNDLNILYIGMPEKDKKFDKMYKSI